MGTPNNTAILPMVEEAGIPTWRRSPGPVVAKNARNVFHVRASYTDEVQRVWQRLMGMGVKGDRHRLPGQRLWPRIARRRQPRTGGCRRQGLGAAALATDGKNLTPCSRRWMRRTLGRADGHGGAATVLLVRGLRKVLPGVLMAGERLLTGDAYKQLGETGRGLVVTMVMPDPTKARPPWCATTRPPKVRGQQEFGLGSLEGYVNMRVLAEGLERAGSDPTRAKLRSALAGIRNWDMGLCGRLRRPGAPCGSRYIDLVCSAPRASSWFKDDRGLGPGGCLSCSCG